MNPDHPQVQVNQQANFLDGLQRMEFPGHLVTHADSHNIPHQHEERACVTQEDISVRYELEGRFTYQDSSLTCEILSNSQGADSEQILSSSNMENLELCNSDIVEEIGVDDMISYEVLDSLDTPTDKLVDGSIQDVLSNGSVETTQQVSELFNGCSSKSSSSYCVMTRTPSNTFNAVVKTPTKADVVTYEVLDPPEVMEEIDDDFLSDNSS